MPRNSVQHMPPMPRGNQHPASSGDPGWWNANLDAVSRPSPPPEVPAKRPRSSFEDLEKDIYRARSTMGGDYNGNLMRVQRGAVALGYGSGQDVPLWYRNGSGNAMSMTGRKRKMQTGCIPCLAKGIPCDPNNPGCRNALSDSWSINDTDREQQHDSLFCNPDSLTLFRPNLKWRRNWRERHSLQFFVNFSAPQMAGFFDSTFWQKNVIQTSYHEPAILHAITAIGALHECIIQRGAVDEVRKARSIEFALDQCNQAIACLTNTQMSEAHAAKRSRRAPDSRLALTTCVLFTCFEALQGRCDSAVNHALQGKRLLQSIGRANPSTMAPTEADDIEHMRPIVERLEVQATALLDKNRRPDASTPNHLPPLPEILYVFSLDHAHSTLHTALNSVMGFMRNYDPALPASINASTATQKYLRYAPWFARWEEAFTAYLSSTRAGLSPTDLKRAMVLKANHLVGSMLATVDQRAGAAAYDTYEAEFRAIVDLSREVLASFSCPPLPSLSAGASGTPYLSFSLWVTDPLWMAVSRCRTASIRQGAFTLLSQNPRQEGIWHAGPQLAMSRPAPPSPARVGTVKEVEEKASAREVRGGGAGGGKKKTPASFGSGTSVGEAQSKFAARVGEVEGRQMGRPVPVVISEEEPDRLEMATLERG